MKRSLAYTMALSTVLSGTVAAPALAAGEEVLGLSLAELSDVKVTSVSKKEEKASEAPAAIFVVTQEDISRTGATSIPEVLRIVPGLNVAQISNHKWAVSARGFNDQFSNKLLVMIDGRTVYTPLFSGTYWDTQDTPMQDIERIEVIRGPGATLWGANAVNGVINIITKHSGETQGGLASVTAGTGGMPNSVARYGAKEGDTSYRVYAQNTLKGELRRTTGDGADDEYGKTQAGFRADRESGNEKYTVQGDAFYSEQSSLLALPINSGSNITNRSDNYFVSGGNVLGRYTRNMAEDGEASLQVYVDYFKSSSYPYDHSQTTLDVDFQHAFNPAQGHEMVWGAGYRVVADDIDGTFYVDFAPESKTANLFTMFAQDKVSLIDNTLSLTIGSKFEHNDYTGFEFQPSARLSWLIDERQNAWASVSRALRTPSRCTDGCSLINSASGAAYVRVLGSSKVQAEEVVAYEAGYRVAPVKNVSVDVSGFYNKYDSLANLVQGSVYVETGLGLPPRAVVPLRYTSTGEGYTWGGELSTAWNVNENLKLQVGYSLLSMRLEGSSTVTSNDKSPQQQLSARAYYNISKDWTWDNMVYWVDNIRPTGSAPAKEIDAYARFDTRIAYKPAENLELSLIGQNLLQASHSEFAGATYNYQTEIPRAVYVNATMSF